jgi:hypothetical protein
MKAFQLGGATVTLTPTTSNDSDDITPTGGVIRVYNAGPSTAFFKTDIGSATATTSDVPLAAGTVESFTIPANHNKAAAICSSGSATVYVTVGSGI